MAGATGLDYAGCRAAADAEGIEWAEVFPLFRLLEIERLKKWGEDAERERQKQKKV